MTNARQAEHEWLDALVGEWTVEVEMMMGPDKPTEKTWGTESVRSLGGLWTVGEGTMDAPGGGTATNLMTLGYDPQKQRFVGTFVASIMTFLWVYEGSLDAEKRTLTLDTTGPNMMEPGNKMMKFQDIIEIVGPDERILRSRAFGNDGKWVQFMEARYRRKK
ncbi:MAG: DUF1579 domain-containing protein [Candidatus Eisenbacteria bacterium]